MRFGQASVTASYALGMVGAMVAAMILMRVGERHRRVASEARTEAVRRRVVGTTPEVQFVRMLGDTIRMGHTGSHGVLLFVTAPGCRPCEKLARRLAASDSRPNASRLEIWEIGGLNAQQTRSLARLGVPVQHVRPVDDTLFLERFGAERIPYLVLLDSRGVIREVQVGFWRHVPIERFLSTSPDDPERATGKP